MGEPRFNRGRRENGDGRTPIQSGEMGKMQTVMDARGKRNGRKEILVN